MCVAGSMRWTPGLYTSNSEGEVEFDNTEPKGSGGFNIDEDKRSQTQFILESVFRFSEPSYDLLLHTRYEFLGIYDLDK